MIGVEYATIFSRAGREGDAGRAARRMLPISSTARSSTSSSTTCATAASPSGFGAKVDRRRASSGPAGCRVALSDGRAAAAPTWCCSAAGRDGATDSLDLDACGLEADDRGRLAVDKTTFQTGSAAHLCRRRRHRLPEPRLDLDGAGPHRRLPRLRRAGPRARRSSSPTASIRCRRSRPIGMTEEQARERGIPLRVRRRPVPRDLARPHHGPRRRAS